MNIAGLKNHLTNWREWELNPIVIKELRQAVRSWTVTGMLMLFLVVLFLVALISLLNYSFNINTDLQVGGVLFRSFFIILAGASLLFIPMYMGIRMAAERVESNTDLLYVSTLSPTRIIRGKVLCGAYVTLLFFSVCMPFMAFTNLLRGVDLPTIFYILAFLFVVVCATNQLAIFIACLPMSRPFKMLLALAGLAGLFGITTLVIEVAYQLMRSGIFSGSYFWAGNATVLGCLLALTGWLYVLSVALITPHSANRALLPRLYLTGAWLLGGGTTMAWAYHEGTSAIIFAWTVISTLFLVLALLVTICNQDHLSVRVRRTIPASRPARMAAFLFYNGAAGGILWILLLLWLTYAITIEFITLSNNRMEINGLIEFRQQFPTLILYILTYALAGLYVHRTFFARRMPQFAGIFAVIIAALAAIGPLIVLFFLNRLSWHSVEELQLGSAINLFVVREPAQLTLHYYFALGSFLIAMLLNFRWFLTQATNFQRPPAPTPVAAPK